MADFRGCFFVVQNVFLVHAMGRFASYMGKRMLSPINS
jgi:hypothetical protein